MTKKVVEIDVLCIGHACYDLIFSVAQHPKADEKIFANDLLGCGGGPAANAAIAVSRLGLTSAFSGYLGQDFYGEMHLHELAHHHVNTQLIVRDTSPTPVSAVLVKPDGKRALINYKGSTKALPANAIDFSSIKAKSILFDGHESHLSLSLLESAKDYGIPTILDAGSMHEGTAQLWNQVDYLVTSEKFAYHFSDDIHKALNRLAETSHAVVITRGDKGLIWQRGNQSGTLAAFPVNAIDTTGAGDAFHGAFAVAVATNIKWLDILAYSSAAGALCCTKLGARQGLPWQGEHNEFLKMNLSD